VIFFSMKSIFGFLYGFSIIVIVYSLTWVVQKMIFKMKVLSFLTILLRYFFYWFLLKKGFLYFSVYSIVFGLVVGTYFGLTFFYFLNDKILKKNIPCSN